ncbi:glutamate racemase [Petrimonas mucosa]|uniref:Glutamate racemase n=1 Tax=Petrimonas mucosa TaxID=1642646 RepID=A0A1G4GAC6_9BACT|nr:glutamate racemase [Petrimonas mucosa]SCM59445.1 Glutamate racemase {ECO:0000255/HAMAP-Rule:MF_00258} [Petrimonas mucosa]
MTGDTEQQQSPIGIFDSGYGGLTVLSEIRSLLPQYDYIYLGDNARAPYGNRSFDAVYRFTRDAVTWFFEQNCRLVILACNTASAKALRTIQQVDLPKIDPSRRVLGVIRPTVESVARFTKNGHVGLFGTTGTVISGSYEIEIAKLYPHLKVSAEACPMWVPLVENNEFDKPGADYFIKQHIDNLLRKDDLIDTIILGCTHYPLLIDKIIEFLPKGREIRVISQGRHVAESLKDYLHRHPEIEKRCSVNGTVNYFTTDLPGKFVDLASLFLNETIEAEKINIDYLC